MKKADTSAAQKKRKKKVQKNLVYTHSHNNGVTRKKINKRYKTQKVQNIPYGIHAKCQLQTSPS